MSSISYSSMYASFLVYVLRCVRNPELDPELIHHEDNRVQAQLLLDKLDKLCKRSNIVKEMAGLTLRPSEDAYLYQAPFVQDHRYTRSVMDAALELFDPIHALSWSLMQYPNNVPATTSQLRLPTMRFFAWKAWDAYTRSFRTPNTLHGILCQIQWFMRLVVFCQFTLEAGQRGFAQRNETSYQALVRLHNTYLLQDQATPFGVLQEQVRYSCVIAGTIAHAPTTTWHSDISAISIHGETVSLESYVEMVKSTIARARRILDQELLFGCRETICGLQKGYIRRAATIKDNTNSNLLGYSYFRANRCFSDSEHKLAQYLTHDPKLVGRFHLRAALESDSLAWNTAAILRWLYAADVFLLHLAACIYWASGQPCRLPELVSLSVENLPERSRNVFAVQTFLMIVQTYPKSLMVKQKSTHTVRMPAYEVQELIEAFWVLVHPLMKQFYSILGIQNFAAPLLFTQRGQPMSETEVSKFLQQVSLEHTGFKWGARPWRQFIISMSHMLIPSNILSLPVATTIMTAQASHSQRAVELAYDQQEDLSVEHISTQRFQQFRMVSLAWLEAIGLPHPVLSCSQELRLIVDPVHATSTKSQGPTLDEITRSMIQQLNAGERVTIRTIVRDEVISFRWHKF
jgi:hypothetical protein